MKIGVTGGAGFVGSAIVAALLRARRKDDDKPVVEELVVVDDLSKGRKENFAQVTRGYEAVAKLAIGDAGLGGKGLETCDVIVHAAAYPDVSANWVDQTERVKQWERNAELTRAVLELAQPEAKFVLISTCSVYGAGTVDEHSVPMATSPYAASKLAAEAWTCAFHAAGRVDAHILRLVNVVGPRYAHGHLADFVRMAKEGHLHAKDDGKKRKPFVHADDVADLVVHIAKMKPRGKERTPMLANVTSDVVWSWRDSVAVMRAMRPGRTFKLTHEERPSGWIGDPEQLAVSSAHVTGFQNHSIVDGVHDALVGLGW